MDTPRTTSSSSPDAMRRAAQARAMARRVAVGGVLMSLLLTGYIALLERRGVSEEVRQLTAERTELLASTVRVSMQVLYSLQSLHEATGGIEPLAFTRFARDARSRHPELQALEWAPRVEAAQRAAFESSVSGSADPSVVKPGYAITDVAADGSLRPAAERARYFPVRLIEPLQGNEPALGLDMAQDARRSAALVRAGESRLPTATAPLRLAQEATKDSAKNSAPDTTQLATQARRLGFLVFLPLYGAQLEPPSPKELPEGYVLAVFRFDDLIRHAMRDLDGRGFLFTVEDITDGVPVRVYGVDDDHGGLGHPASTWLVPAVARQTTLDVAGRRWRLRFEPEARFLWTHLPWQTAAMLLGGLLLTAILAGSMRLLARRDDEITAANAALRAEVLQREEAVRAAEHASRSKSIFLANMSHEIRTPMNAVLGYAQLLRRDERLDEWQREAANAIVSSGSHLMRQINDVLDLSKVESGRMELNSIDFDVDQLLGELRTMFEPRCREAGLRLLVERVGRSEGVEPATCWLHGDAGKVQQILINLLGNAVRFTKVGEVAVRAFVAEAAGLRVDVIDTGLGIAEGELERIFEPFHQVRSEAASGGSGLGLAIARRQAEAMGGALTVKSEPGAGSVFTFTVPLLRAESGRTRPVGQGAARWALRAGEALDALVVDDVAFNRDVLARVLRDAGCTVREAGDAPGALQAFAERAPDIAFIDMRMPGVDGVTLVRSMRAGLHKGSLVIVAYTAAAFESDRERFIAAGCDDVITKPLDVDRLFTVTAALTGRHFDVADAASDADSGDVPLRQPDFAHLRVPDALLQRMVTAAELHSATMLKACLEELRLLGPEHELLARHLRQHQRAYDMNGVLKLLQLVLPEAPSAEDRLQEPNDTERLP